MLNNSRGMTLLEVMVAMAIFAGSGIALIKAATEQANAIGMQEEKLFAAWVAENQMVSVKLITTTPNLNWQLGEEVMMGRTFHWRWHGVETERTGFRAIEVEVRTSAGDADPRVTLRSYLAQQ